MKKKCRYGMKRVWSVRICPYVIEAYLVEFQIIWKLKLNFQTSWLSAVVKPFCVSGHGIVHEAAWRNI